MKKKQAEVWSLKRIKKLKREDGLTMKTVNKYTMDAVVDCTSSRNPDGIALRTYREEGSEITYAQLKLMKDAISITLLEAGFSRGDKIAIMGESCPTWMVAYFGITSIGCVAVPILPDFSTKETTQILEHAGAKGVVINVKHFEKAKAYVQANESYLVRMEDLFHIPSSIVQGLEDKTQFAAAPGKDISRRKIDEKGRKLREASLAREDDLASLIYTS
ncbi:AMP-binding protein, partial [Sphaerochaeta sp. S2]|uniref:AMP-binding protein n=1 Tax=Sphaerochaeta sp. S2 TaxID=2798868 RepID=UPI0018E95F9F